MWMSSELKFLSCREKVAHSPNITLPQSVVNLTEWYYIRVIHYNEGLDIEKDFDISGWYLIDWTLHSKLLSECLYQSKFTWPFFPRPCPIPMSLFLSHLSPLHLSPIPPTTPIPLFSLAPDFPMTAANPSVACLFPVPPLVFPLPPQVRRYTGPIIQLVDHVDNVVVSVEGLIRTET